MDRSKIKIPYKLICVIFGLLCMYCSDSPDVLWENARLARDKNKFNESIISLNEIIIKHSKHALASQANYQIAEIYLNDIKDVDYAIEEYKKIIRNYPESDEARKSLFMIAYSYNNSLQAYSDALEYYNMFKDKYPDDELIPSVDFELGNLKSLSNVIDSLNKTIQK